jgi:uncharacterized DUF497 family protein
MRILWDETKNRQLMVERGISFEVFADIILDKKYLDMLENPSRPDHRIYGGERDEN